MTGGVGGVQGSLAEYAARRCKRCSRAGEQSEHERGRPISADLITARVGRLVDRAQVKAARTCLIHGGAGGVGHVAVQIARRLARMMFATGSARASLISNSLAHAIDYEGAAVEQYVEDHTGARAWTSVCDNVGGATSMRFQTAIKRFGVSSAALGGARMRWRRCRSRGRTYSGVFHAAAVLYG